MMNFVDLNDDCLLKIVEYLNTEEKLCLWEATEPTSRLADITSYAWRRQTKHAIDLNHFTDMELLNSFLSIICTTVVEVSLVIGDVRNDQMNIFQRHVFPKARVLNVNVTMEWEDDLGFPAGIDWEIGVLAGCFPNVERLHVDGEKFATTGKNFSKWNRLTHLDVVKASEFWTTFNFWTVCDSAKKITSLSINFDDEFTLKSTPFVKAICSLENLEQLWFDAMNINESNARNLLTKLPKLRRLRCTESQNWTPLRHLREFRAHDVRSITLSTPCLCYSLGDFEPDPDVAGAQFYRLTKYFNRLEAMHLKRSSICGSGDQLWDMIRGCPQLKMISVRTIDMNFFNSMNANINRALRRRSEPLNFHVQDTDHKNLITAMLNRPDVNLTFGPLPKQIEVFKNYCIEFELFPIAS
ncbi:hypothetical protein KR074_001961 [Drosophila pseudoananassae]|nr:hypothetical protein KR074_001961 [Drosophila pseudoananassae]